MSDSEDVAEGPVGRNRPWLAGKIGDVLCLMLLILSWLLVFFGVNLVLLGLAWLIFQRSPALLFGGLGLLVLSVPVVGLTAWVLKLTNRRFSLLPVSHKVGKTAERASLIPGPDHFSKPVAKASEDNRTGMSTSTTSRRVQLWALAGKALTTLALVIGIVVGGMEIYARLKRDEPAAFRGRGLETAEGAAAFRSFLLENDGKAIYLDTNCVRPEQGWTGCLWRSGTEERYRGLLNEKTEDPVNLLAVSADRTCDMAEPKDDRYCPDEYWVWLRVTHGSGAQVNNGSYGAGNLVAKGYFTVTVKGGLGTTAPSVTNVDLIAVRANEVR